MCIATRRAHGRRLPKPMSLLMSREAVLKSLRVSVRSTTWLFCWSCSAVRCTPPTATIPAFASGRSPLRTSTFITTRVRKRWPAASRASPKRSRRRSGAISARRPDACTSSSSIRPTSRTGGPTPLRTTSSKSPPPRRPAGARSATRTTGSGWCSRTSTRTSCTSRRRAAGSAACAACSAVSRCSSRTCFSRCGR